MDHQQQPLAVALVEQPLPGVAPNQKQPPAHAVAQEKLIGLSLLLVMTRPCHIENLERREGLSAARVVNLPGNQKESGLAMRVAE